MERGMRLPSVLGDGLRQIDEAVVAPADRQTPKRPNVDAKRQTLTG